MNRAGMVAVLVVTLAARASFGQFGGMGGGAGPAQGTPRAFEVEVEEVGGKRLAGPLAYPGMIAVDGDFGRYAIDPAKVRAIRLEQGGEGQVPFADADGMPIRGAVLTTTGEEIEGLLLIPPHWTITTEIGTLTLAPQKLKSITFLPAPDAAAEGEDAAGPAGPGAFGRGGRARAFRMGAFGQGGRARAFRINDQVWAVSPTGHRVAVRDAASGKTATLELPASEEAPLEVIPIASAGLAALLLEGDEITRIAAFSAGDGQWHPQDLREPVSGRASPIVSAMTAAYGLGRFVYAFSAEANRWDVLELPEGVAAGPVVQPHSVVVQYDGQIHTFRTGSGTWEHVDANDLLGEDDPEG